MEKTALIVTDGTENMEEMAKAISSSLHDFKVTLLSAKKFAGTDLLPASLIFFGAENPDPPSFAYLQKLLAHINLAGRPCGIFSASQESADYLRTIARDSELKLYPEPLINKGDIQAWIKKITAGF